MSIQNNKIFLKPCGVKLYTEDVKYDLFSPFSDKCRLFQVNFLINAAFVDAAFIRGRRLLEGDGYFTFSSQVQRLKEEMLYSSQLQCNATLNSGDYVLKPEHRHFLASNKIDASCQLNFYDSGWRLLLTLSIQLCNLCLHKDLPFRHWITHLFNNQSPIIQQVGLDLLEESLLLLL